MALRNGLLRGSALQHDGFDAPVILQCRTLQENKSYGPLGATLRFHKFPTTSLGLTLHWALQWVIIVSVCKCVCVCVRCVCVFVFVCGGALIVGLAGSRVRISGSVLKSESAPKQILETVSWEVWHRIAQHFENAVQCSAKRSGRLMPRIVSGHFLISGPAPNF